MKKITTYLKLFAALSLFLSVSIGYSQCPVPNFSFTTNSSGTATFVSTSTNTNSSTSYSWSSPSGSPTLTAGTNVTQAIVNYTNNGWQRMTLTVNNATMNCPATYSANVTFSTLPCSLNADFTVSYYPPFGMQFSAAPSTGVANGLATYTWDYGDGSAPGSGSFAGRNYTSNGTYTVNLTINNNTSPACISSHSAVITVTNACSAVPDFTYALSPSGTVSLTSTSTGTNAGMMYTWIIDGATPDYTTGIGLTQVAGTYTNTGVYYLVLSISSTAPSCSTTAVRTITVSNLPCTLNAGFTSSNSGNPGQVVFNNTSTGTAPGLTTYSYNFGDATGTATQSAAHIYASNGTYTVTFSVDNHFSPACISSYSAVVTVTTVCSLTSNFTYTLNPSGTVSLTSISTGTNAGSVYTWLFNGATPNYSLGTGLTQANTAYSSNGVYNLVLGVSSTAPSCSNTAVQTITVSSFPCALNASFNYTATSSAGLVYLSNTSTGIAPGLTTYSYNFGDGTGAPSSPSYNSTHTYTSNGTYTVTLSVDNHLSPACISSYSTVITVTSICTTPAAGFTYTLNPSGTVSLTSISTGTLSGTTYIWQFLGGSPNYTSAVGLTQTSTTFTNNGIYNLALSLVNAPSCSNTAVQTITITNLPCTLNAGFTSTNGSNPGQVIFNSNSTGTAPGLTTYTYNFGDATGTATQSPSHTYASNGSYTVTLTVNNNLSPACISTYSAVVTVTSVCNLVPSFTYSVGANGAVSFTSTSTGSGLASAYYKWFFVQGVPASAFGTNLVNPSTTFTTNGSKTVLFSIESAAHTCSLAISQTISISNVTCSLVPDFVVTPGGNGAMYFTNTSNVFASYSWNFGDASPTSTVASPAHTYTANGTYTVTLSNSNLTCTSTKTMVITVSNHCDLNGSFTYTTGPNGSVSFSSTSTGTSALGANYAWNFPLGVPSYTAGTNFTTPSTTYTSNGVKNTALVIVGSAPGCSVVVSQTLNITNVTPTCNVSANFSITQGSNGLVYFANTSTGTSTNSTYYWNFGDASTATLTSPAHTYTANGAYTATMVVTNYTCTSTQTMVVVVNNICNLAAGFTYTTGSNGSVAFSNTSTGTNSSTQYAWNFGDGGTNATASPSHNYLLNGTYTVILTATNPSVSPTCTSTVSQVIVISTSTCVADASFTLVPSGTPQYWHAIPSNTANIANAVWNWGDGSSSTGLYSSHTYSAAGNYSMCLSVTITCGASATSCATYYVSRSADDNSVVYVDVINADQVTTALKNNAADKTVYTVFPNPNNGVFNVSISGLSSVKAKINVYNVVGAQVYASESETSNGTLVKDINLDGLSNGVYFIKVNAGNKEYTKKLVINK